KGAGVIEEPERPDLSPYGDQPEACEADDRWAVEPRLNYPRDYQRRGIEGWVTFRYDVAPWGKIGNVEVIDAQPAMDLVRYAQPVLTSAEYKPSKSGLSGCIERVVFKLPEKGAQSED
ncbi:MAG: energy transducer TonB, partial [Pseudomonadota bacterium]